MLAKLEENKPSVKIRRDKKTKLEAMKSIKKKLTKLTGS